MCDHVLFFFLNAANVYECRVAPTEKTVCFVTVGFLHMCSRVSCILSFLSAGCLHTRVELSTIIACEGLICGYVRQGNTPLSAEHD